MIRIKLHWASLPWFYLHFTTQIALVTDWSKQFEKRRHSLAVVYSIISFDRDRFLWLRFEKSGSQTQVLTTIWKMNRFKQAMKTNNFWSCDQPKTSPTAPHQKKFEKIRVSIGRVILENKTLIFLNFQQHQDVYNKWKCDKKRIHDLVNKQAYPKPCFL